MGGFLGHPQDLHFRLQPDHWTDLHVVLVLLESCALPEAAFVAADLRTIHKHLHSQGRVDGIERLPAEGTCSFQAAALLVPTLFPQGLLEDPVQARHARGVLARKPVWSVHDIEAYAAGQDLSVNAVYNSSSRHGHRDAEAIVVREQTISLVKAVHHKASARANTHRRNDSNISSSSSSSSSVDSSVRSRIRSSSGSSSCSSSTSTTSTTSTISSKKKTCVQEKTMLRIFAKRAI